MLINKIINGNSLNVLRKLEDDSIDLVFTSPPYFNLRNYSTSDKEIGREESVDEYIENLMEIMKECCRIVKESGNIVVNIGDKYKDSSLLLIPYRFAIKSLERFPLILVNDIIWSKLNPTPSPNKNRLVSSKEPLFHFSLSNKNTYNISEFQNNNIKKVKSKSKNIGKSYFKLIEDSGLSTKEKNNAKKELERTIGDIESGKICSFRMKIRGVHALAYGGQQGGRNTQIQNNGFTIIRMSGESMKKDVIEYAVETIKGTDHPAIYPQEMVEDLIILLSNKGDIILDPFMGSGTTALAAIQTDRNFIGIDINKGFCKSAEERIESIIRDKNSRLF